MKLVDIILEQNNKPKAVIMAGGSGAGKTYLLGQLSLQSLTQFNPDKYVEDPEHQYYNNLGSASRQVDKDVAAAASSSARLARESNTRKKVRRMTKAPLVEGTRIRQRMISCSMRPSSSTLEG